jgi:hypothetical protein
MAQFLKVHHGRSSRATAQEALYRATLAPAKMLGVDQKTGRLEVGRPMSYIEVECDEVASLSVDDAILKGVLGTSWPQIEGFAQRRECRAALDRLATLGLDIGPDLECLSEEVGRTKNQVEGRVIRVTIAGKTVWERAQKRAPL